MCCSHQREDGVHGICLDDFDHRSERRENGRREAKKSEAGGENPIEINFWRLPNESTSRKPCNVSYVLISSYPNISNLKINFQRMILQLPEEHLTMISLVQNGRSDSTVQRFWAASVKYNDTAFGKYQQDHKDIRAYHNKATQWFYNGKRVPLESIVFNAYAQFACIVFPVRIRFDAEVFYRLRCVMITTTSAPLYEVKQEETPSVRLARKRRR